MKQQLPSAVHEINVSLGHIAASVRDYRSTGVAADLWEPVVSLTKGSNEYANAGRSPELTILWVFNQLPAPVAAPVAWRTSGA